MRIDARVVVGFGGVLLGAAALWFLGPAVLFMLFHSDWETVPHLLTVKAPASPLRVEVVSSKSQVLWAIENREEAPVHDLDYGVVPKGFVQLVPAVGPPPDVSSERVVGVWYCDNRGGGALVQARLRRGSIQHGLAYWGQSLDGTLCDRRFLYSGWTLP